MVFPSEIRETISIDYDTVSDPFSLPHPYSACLITKSLVDNAILTVQSSIDLIAWADEQSYALGSSEKPLSIDLRAIASPNKFYRFATDKVTALEIRVYSGGNPNMSQALNLLLYGVPFDSDYIDGAFVVKVDSTNITSGGTASNQMGFYFEGSYDVTIHDDEGNSYSRSGASAREDITFTASGEHICQIVDNGSTGFQCGVFTASGVTRAARDNEKYIEILQWGDWDAKSGNSAFRRCSELIAVFATDAPTLSGANTANNFFNDCTALITLNGFENWDFSTQNSVVGFFLDCSSLVQSTDVTPQNVNNIFTVTACWANASADATRFYFPSTATITGTRDMCKEVNADLSGHGLLSWMAGANLAPTDTGLEFATSSNIGTTKYENILSALIAGGTTNQEFDAGNQTARSAAAQTSIDTLKAAGWTGSDASGAW